MPTLGPTPSPDFGDDVREIQSLEIVSTLLHVISEFSGLGFTAIARVTESHWTALAVQDRIALGVVPGQQLDIHTTICKEVREVRQAVVIDHASQHPIYKDHHTPKMYNFESYISVPIVLSNGDYYGNLCGLDRVPVKLGETRILSMFNLFSRLLALQLESERQRKATASEIVIERANSALREQFIGILGHDLRSPLSGIRYGVEALRLAPGDASMVRKVTERMSSSVQRMSLLIDDVVDFARGRLGGGFGVKISREDNLAAALEHVVAELRAAYPARQVNAFVDIPRAVTCDRTRVEQLASNLLANALFHGDAATPVVFGAHIEGTDLVIKVLNGGKAIDADYLPKLFDAFSQGRHAADGKGMGLGLYICSQVVKAHGGTIEVTSSEAAGTEFVARLPVDGARSGCT